MKKLYIIHLKGTQEEMGAQYGEMTDELEPLEEIEMTMTSLPMRLLSDCNHHSVGGRLTNGVIKMLLSAKSKKMEKHRPPEYKARSYAMFRAAGKPVSLSRQMTIMDTFQNIIGLAGRLGIGPFERKASQAAVAACSSIAVWDSSSSDGALRHGRNFDLPCIGAWDERPTVVFCTPVEGHRYGYVSSLGVDVPGITGFNEKGLCVTAHTRFHRDGRSDGAAIVDLCHDIIRRATNLDQAVEICNERPICSTWGLCISSAVDKKAVVVETTGKGAWTVEPAPGSDYMVCANRNRHPETVPGQVVPFPGFPEHSDKRESRIRQVVDAGRSDGGVSKSDIMALLGDQIDPTTGVARSGGGVIGQAMSVQSVVFEPERKVVHVSVGATPTGRGPYVEVPWDWNAPVGHQFIETDATTDRTKAPGSPEQQDAYEHWKDACIIDTYHHDPAKTLEHIEKALALAPEDPTYLFMAGVLHLRHGNWETAHKHLVTCTEQVNPPFRQVQSLLWAARAADLCEKTDQARAFREEALELEDIHTAPLHELIRKDLKKGVSKRKMRRLIYNVDLADAAI